MGNLAQIKLSFQRVHNRSYSTFPHWLSDFCTFVSSLFFFPGYRRPRELLEVEREAEASNEVCVGKGGWHGGGGGGGDRTGLALFCFSPHYIWSSSRVELQFLFLPLNSKMLKRQKIDAVGVYMVYLKWHQIMYTSSISFYPVLSLRHTHSNYLKEIKSNGMMANLSRELWFFVHCIWLLHFLKLTKDPFSLWKSRMFCKKNQEKTGFEYSHMPNIPHKESQM